MFFYFSSFGLRAIQSSKIVMYNPPIIDSVMIRGFESRTGVNNIIREAMRFATIKIIVTMASGLSNFLINNEATLGIRRVTIKIIRDATLTPLDKSKNASDKPATTAITTMLASTIKSFCLRGTIYLT